MNIWRRGLKGMGKGSAGERQRKGRICKRGKREEGRVGSVWWRNWGAVCNWWGRGVEKIFFLDFFKKKVCFMFVSYDNFLSLHSKKVFQNGKLLEGPKWKSFPFWKTFREWRKWKTTEKEQVREREVEKQLNYERQKVVQKWEKGSEGVLKKSAGMATQDWAKWIRKRSFTDNNITSEHRLIMSIDGQWYVLT